jgi:hypothetical protein
MLLFTTCKESEIYPVIPQLVYKSSYVLFDQFNQDSLIVVKFAYYDGDGDIGLNAGDTFAPYNRVSDPNTPGKNINRYYDNCFARYYDYKNGRFVPTVNPNDVKDTIIYTFRIPSLTPEGKHKAIRGEMEILMFPSEYDDRSDTVQFKVSICDRALHESNTIETPPIYLYKTE